MNKILPLLGLVALSFSVEAQSTGKSSAVTNAKPITSAQKSKQEQIVPAATPVQVPATVVDNRVLFTVGGDKVTVAEFEYVYNKNNVNNQADYSEKSLTDYLALYQNFRLKVKEAEAMKLDTISSLQNELEGYRKQLAKTYLTDREISEKLILEAYERTQKEVNASHILVKCDDNANPADTLAAYKKIMALRKRVEKGESFEKVAKDNSEDPSAKTNEGNIGWFGAFGTIYPFENVAYSLRPGELSQPVRTEFGYHLVRLNESRPARGQIHVAHLLLRFPEKPTTIQQDSIHKLIDSVYALIKTGRISFEDAVKSFSDDKATRIKGGELQWFGTGTSIKMVPEFEDASFALQTDGELSKPIATQYGWHLIKRLEKREIQPFSEVKTEIKKKVERDSRSQVAKSVLINRIKTENNFREFPEAKAVLFSRLDSSIARGNWKADSTLLSAKPLFELAAKNYTISDFVLYIEKTAKRRTDKALDALLHEYYDSFVSSKCLEYEESMLEQKKPEFRNLVKEYRDGILLFELMDRMVWTKAVKDTTGLEAYRQKNSTKYMWDQRADVIIYNCNDEKICNEAFKLAKKKKSADEIKAKLNKSGQNAYVSYIEGKYEKGQYDVVDNIDWVPGLTPVKKLNDSSYQFLLVKQLVAPEPKGLKDAKGYIVSDYQEYLEKTWLSELRDKYPVNMDATVLKSLVKN